MQIFLGAPFTQDINKNTSIVHTHKVNFIINLIEQLEQKGHVVRNAHKREKFGKELMHPLVCTKEDFKEIQDCDLFLAIVGNPPSGGVQVELGWASALNKRIILLLHEETEYSPLVNGLSSVTDSKIIRFRDETEIPKILEGEICTELIV